MSCESFDLDSISQLSLADSSVDIFKSSFANSKSISSDNIPQVKIAELRVEDLCAQDLHSYTSASHRSSFPHAFVRSKLAVLPEEQGTLTRKKEAR